MGRSVETVSCEAGGVIYIDCSYMYEPEVEYTCECGWEDYPGKELAECPECGRDDIEKILHERDGQYEWQDLCENIVSALSDHFKSLKEPSTKEWLGYPYQENQILLSNNHCQISISEYCGCGAINVFETKEYSEYPELAISWTDRNFEKIQKLCEPFIDQIRKIGSVSNGEAFFEKV